METAKSIIRSSLYREFLSDIKKRVQQARLTAYRSVNREMLTLYWNIGKGIVERQDRLGWGKSIVEQLAMDLRKEFPGTAGFSPQNLWYMRKFYLAYRERPNLQQLAGEIPWFSNVAILDRVSSFPAKEYYLKATGQCGWSRNVLIHQIESGAYERQRAAKKLNNFKQVLPKHLAEQADLATKDSYTLDFLGQSAPVLERELHAGLLRHMRDFIVELGLGFCFAGSQHRITLGDKEYFVDLLFYHRHLKCLVAMELKIGDFKPEYAGKLNFYLNLLDSQMKLSHENPSIGIILCKSKSKLEVEYALRGIAKPMGVAHYVLARRPPKSLSGELPTAQQLKAGFREMSHLEISHD